MSLTFFTKVLQMSLYMVQGFGPWMGCDSGDQNWRLFLQEPSSLSENDMNLSFLSKPQSLEPDLKNEQKENQKETAVSYVAADQNYLSGINRH